VVISEEERRSTAYHEAGHVLVAKFTPNCDPVHKVTIIPRGRALGVTHFVPLDDKHSYSRGYLEGRLAILMGGRVAEWLVFKEYTSGAADDLKRATEIAKQMVTQWGMSDSLGPLTYGRKEEEVFLGRDFSHRQDYSDRTAMMIDNAVREIVENGEASAEKIITREMDRLHKLAANLVERESLDAIEIDAILELAAAGDNGVAAMAESAARRSQGDA